MQKRLYLVGWPMPFWMGSSILQVMECDWNLRVVYLPLCSSCTVLETIVFSARKRNE